MPKTGITEYDLLVLCPGDAEEFICTIEKAAKKFNRYFGREHNICVQTRDWQRDRYSQAEDASHSLRRKHFIGDCDMAVAVFWTGFGAPADESEPGAKEEMQTMIESEKQVFLYFLEKPIFPSKISPDYIRVQEFREQCKKKGIYFEVSDEKELLYNFFEDLIKFFSEKDTEKEELPVKDISALSKGHSAWLAEDKRIMIGIFP